MIAFRNVSETAGQNAYSQALEKELKQATKAFPNKSGWNNQRPRNQAAFRQRKNWYRSRNPAGPGRWNGGGLWQGRGGGSIFSSIKRHRARNSVLTMRHPLA